MLTFILYLALGILILALLNWMPGVKVLVSPTIGMITKLVEEAFKHSVGYLIWIGKLIFASHIDFINHLFHGRKHFDPTDDFEG